MHQIEFKDQPFDVISATAAMTGTTGPVEAESLVEPNGPFIAGIDEQCHPLGVLKRVDNFLEQEVTNPLPQSICRDIELLEIDGLFIEERENEARQLLSIVGDNELTIRAH